MTKTVMNEREMMPNVIPDDMYFSFNKLCLLMVVNKEELCKFFVCLSKMMERVGDNERANLFLENKNHYENNSEIFKSIFEDIKVDNNLYMDSFNMELFNYSNEFIGVSFDVCLRDDVMRYLNDLLKGSMDRSYIRNKYPWVNITSDYRNYLFNYELLIIKKSCYNYLDRELSFLKLTKLNPMSLDIFTTNCTTDELKPFEIKLFNECYFDYFSDELRNGRVVSNNILDDYSSYYISVLNKYYIDEFKGVIDKKEFSLDKYFSNKKKLYIKDYLNLNKNYSIYKSLLVSSVKDEKLLKDFNILVNRSNELDTRFNNIISTKNISYALFLSKLSILISILSILFNEYLIKYVETFVKILFK